MAQDQRTVQLLLDFDQAISWPDTKSVANKALAFFDSHLELERVSITLNDLGHAFFEVFTRDTSVPDLSSGHRHRIPASTPKKTASDKAPRYIPEIRKLTKPSPVIKVLTEAGVQSFFDVPLIIGEEVVGALNVGSRQKDGISIEIQEITTLLSARLSLALFHSRLHDDLKQKEAALAASERGQRELIDQAADIIIRCDLQGRIIQANIATTRLLGYSNEELLGMNIKDLFEPNILIKKPLRYDLLEEGLTVLNERVFRTKSGQNIPIEMNSKKLSDGTLVSIVRDVSERNSTNALLQDQKNKISAFLDATPTPMYAKDTQGRYTMLNEAYLNFFGKKREEMIGKTVSEVWDNQRARQFEKDDQLLVKHNKRQSYSAEITDGHENFHQILVNKARYLDAQGNPAGFVGTFTDLTDLRVAEKRYETLFNNSPDPVVVHDGKILLAANQAAIRFFKSDDAEKYLNSPISNLIHPDSLKDSQERVKEILTQGRPSEIMNQKFIIATGEVRDVQVMAAPIQDRDRVVIMTSFRDVTDELATREALLNSEERYRRAFEFSPTAMVLHDRGILLEANRAALDFAGAQDIEEVRGMDLLTLVHPDFRGEVQEGIENLLQQDRPASGVREHKYLTLAGAERWVEGSGVPVKQGDKTVILLSFNDIHERVTAQEQLEQSRQQLEVIVDTIPGLFSYADMNEKYLYVNEAYANWYGYAKADVIGKTFSEIIPPEIYQDFKPKLSKIPSGEELTYSQTLRGPDGRDHILDIRNLPLYDKNNQPKAFLTSLQDVTEIREEEVFRDSLRRLARKLTVSLEPRQVGVIAASLLYELFGYDAFSLYKIDVENKLAIGLFAQDTFVGQDAPVEVETAVNKLDKKNKKSVFILSTPLLMNRRSAQKKPPPSPFGDATRMSRSLVFVPIFWEGVQIGLFTLQSYTPEKFQKDDLPKLKIFANQIGGALVRAQADTLIQKQTLELEASVKEKEVLLKEVYHRTKNNMQVIVGLLELQGMKTNNSETQTVVAEMTNRIYIMSMVHDLLYRSKSLAEIMLDSYLEKLADRLIHAYQTTLGVIDLDCKADAIPVNIQTAIPLGLVINEIVSNALKYAFPNHGSGTIRIRARKDGAQGLRVEISDNGSGVEPSLDLSSSETLGMRIIRDIVDLQLFGEVKTQSKNGLKYLITIPNLKLD